ncbi:MAG TPA: hypothetical protein GXX59_10375 [Syntrophomonadaceae bacterium]|nr:hypothetical protein [Syntrophomonadaceae bacterium]
MVNGSTNYSRVIAAVFLQIVKLQGVYILLNSNTLFFILRGIVMGKLQVDSFGALCYIYMEGIRCFPVENIADSFGFFKTASFPVVDGGWLFI